MVISLKMNKILNHFDLWVKLVLKHFDKHKIQGRIFFAELGLSILIWVMITSIYLGEIIKNFILKNK